MDELQDVTAGVLEEDEGAVAELQFHDRFLLVEGAQSIRFTMNDGWFRLGTIFVFHNDMSVEEVRGIETHVQVLDGVLGLGAMLLEKPGLVLPHAARNFVDGFIDAPVHVSGFGGGINGDMIGAKKDDFHDVTFPLNVQNCFGLDDPRVVEVETFNFARGVGFERVSRLFVANCDRDGRGGVCALQW